MMVSTIVPEDPAKLCPCNSCSRALQNRQLKGSIPLIAQDFAFLSKEMPKVIRIMDRMKRIIGKIQRIIGRNCENTRIRQI